MFGNVLKDVNPSRIRFLKDSKVDFTLGFGCSVVVETSEGKWENFRSFYLELYAKLRVELNSNDAIKKIKLNGDVDDLKAVRIKIFKKEEAMVAEETALTMMINMGLNMAKSQIKSALDIPQIGYPSIKKCTGLTLLRPSINIYDGFIVISTDLGVETAEKGCDIMMPPSFKEVISSSKTQTPQADEKEASTNDEDERKEDL